MSRRLPHTPTSVIKHALRLLWMRSRERSEALKNTGYRCSCCGVKQSSAKGKECKLEVHHLYGIDWPDLIELVRDRLLQEPSRLAPLCKDCHDKQHHE